MTEYRTLLDLLKIPYVGNPSKVMAIAADKAKARAVVSAEGVQVPQGVLLRRGDEERFGGYDECCGYALGDVFSSDATAANIRVE